MRVPKIGDLPIKAELAIKRAKKVWAHPRQNAAKGSRNPGKNGSAQMNRACKNTGHSAKEDLFPGMNRQAPANPGNRLDGASHRQRCPCFVERQ